MVPPLNGNTSKLYRNDPSVVVPVPPPATVLTPFVSTIVSLNFLSILIFKLRCIPL